MTPAKITRYLPQLLAQAAGPPQPHWLSFRADPRQIQSPAEHGTCPHCA